MNNTTSLFDCSLPYHALAEYTKRFYLLADSQRTEFWCEVIKSFASMAFHDVISAPPPQLTQRLFKVDLPQLFETASRAGVDDTPYLKRQLLANIYKVSACYFRVGFLDKKQSWGVYQIEVIESETDDVPLYWGWIDEDYVSFKLLYQLDKTKRIIRLNNVSAVQLWALQRYQEFLLSKDDTPLPDIPIPCMLQLLDFAVEWELQKLVKSLWQTMYFFGPCGLTPEFEARWRSYETQLGVPKASKEFIIDKKLEPSEVSTYFRSETPFTSIKAFKGRCTVLSPKVQRDFVETVRDFFTRAAFKGEAVTGSSDTVLSDFQFLEEISPFANQKESARIRTCFFLAIGKYQMNIPSFSLCETPYRHPDDLKELVSWLSKCLEITIKPENKKIGDYRSLFKEEWSVPIPGDPNIRAWIKAMLKLATPEQLGLLVEIADGELLDKVFDEIESRFDHLEKFEIVLQMPGSIYPFVKGSAAGYNPEVRAAILKALLPFYPIPERFSERNSRLLFKFFESQSRDSTMELREVIRNTIDGNPHKKAVLISFFWITFRKDLISYCCEEAWHHLDGHFTIQTFTDIVCKVIHYKSEVTLEEWHVFEAIITKKEFAEAFILSKPLTKVLNNFKWSFPRVVAQNLLNRLLKDHPLSTQIRNDRIVFETLTLLLMPVELLDFPKRKYKVNNEWYNMQLPLQLDRLQIGVVVKFLTSPQFQSWVAAIGTPSDYVELFRNAFKIKGLNNLEEFRRVSDICAEFGARLKADFPDEKVASKLPVKILTRLVRDMDTVEVSKLELLDWFFHLGPDCLEIMESLEKFLTSKESINFFHLNLDLQLFFKLLLAETKAYRKILTRMKESDELKIWVQKDFMYPQHITEAKLFRMFWQMSRITLAEYVQCIVRKIPVFFPSSLFFHPKSHHYPELIEFGAFILSEPVIEWRRKHMPEYIMMPPWPFLDDSLEFSELIRVKQTMLHYELSKESQQLVFNCFIFFYDTSHTRYEVKVKDRKSLCDFLRQFPKLFTHHARIAISQRLLAEMEPKKSWLATLLDW